MFSSYLELNRSFEVIFLPAKRSIFLDFIGNIYTFNKLCDTISLWIVSVDDRFSSYNGIKRKEEKVAFEKLTQDMKTTKYFPDKRYRNKNNLTKVFNVIFFFN